MTVTLQPSLLSLLDGSNKDTLSWITCAARDAIPGVDFASISVAHGDGHLETVGATDPLAAKADALQYQLAEGPCVDAALRTPTCQSDDLSVDGRWPRYAERAAELGIRAQATFPLRGGNQTLGSLNLYSTSPNRLDDVSLDLAQRFADRAATAMELARTANSLTGASATRSIGQAVGSVMDRFALTDKRPRLEVSPVCNRGVTA